MTRRRTHIDIPVSYAAVGATSDPEILRFPPEGTTPYEEQLRLGSGQDRFLAASTLLMTWGAQRGAGIEVSEVVVGDGGHYPGVSFGADGTPRAPGAPEDRFGPDGEPYLTAGTTARLDRSDERAARAIRIVYTVEEPRRVGFAWGSSDEHGVVGEELFLVEHRDDDSVWALVRGFLSAPDAGLLGIAGRATIRAAIASAKTQLASLRPGGTASAGETTAGAGGESAGASDAPDARDAPDAAAEPSS